MEGGGGDEGAGGKVKVARQGKGANRDWGGGGIQLTTLLWQVSLLLLVSISSRWLPCSAGYAR